MSNRFKKMSDQELAALVKDGFDWETTGVLPNGILRIEADRYMEEIPAVNTAVGRKFVREEAIREAAVRWMETQGFQV